MAQTNYIEKAWQDNQTIDSSSSVVDSKNLYINSHTSEIVQRNISKFVIFLK